MLWRKKHEQGHDSFARVQIIASGRLLRPKTLEVMKADSGSACLSTTPSSSVVREGLSVDQPAKGVIPTLQGAKSASLWAASC